MRIKVINVLRLGSVLLALGAAYIGWHEASSTSARTLAVILYFVTAAALASFGVFRLVARHWTFSTVYPIFIIAAGLLLEIDTSGKPVSWVNSAAPLVTILGLVLYANVLRSRRNNV